jgi:hypothetical protein
MGGNYLYHHLTCPWWTLDAPTKKVICKPEDKDMEKVKEFIGAIHTDLELTKDLIAQEHGFDQSDAGLGRW